MLIATDLLLYITTSLVFSIFCLSVLFYYRTRDTFSLNILTVLLPLSLYMGLSCFTTYILRSAAADLFTAKQLGIFSLAITLMSIILSTLLLLTVSLYVLDLLPISKKKRSLGRHIIYFLVLVFLIFSLFFIILKSQGDWNRALDITLKQYFSWGSLFYLIHGTATLFYLKNEKDREVFSLLRGISITFLPIIVLFPLDIIFFTDYVFKLSYICFSIFTINVYFFFSRYYFRVYEPDPASLIISPDLLKKYDISEREKEIISLLIQGKSNIEIGNSLFISVNTVKSHLKNIYKKMSLKNRLQLVSLIHSSQNSS